MDNPTANYQNNNGDETVRLLGSSGPPSSVGSEVGRETPQIDRMQEQIRELNARLREIQRWKCTQLCSRKCFGLGLVFLFVMVLTGVGTGLPVYYKLSSDLMKHATYIVFGARECKITELGNSIAYTGITVGFESTTGTVDYHCMPTNNLHIQYFKNVSSYNDSFNTQVLSGSIVRYNTFRENRENGTVSCALCRIEGREAIEIRPAMYSCAEGWTKQYEGYLMTGGLCVHIEMENGQNMTQRQDDLYLHHKTISKELLEKYNDNQVLSCAVCSK